MIRVFCLTLLVMVVFVGAAFAQADDFWYEKLQIGGMVDGRIIAFDKYAPGEGFDDVRTSDVYIYAATLGVEAEPAEFVKARINMIYEQFPSSPVFLGAKTDELSVDEAYVRFSLFWLYFQLGKFYQPFLHYQPLSISDSLPYILGEMNTTAYEVGLDSDYFAVSFSGFNGVSDLTDEPERIDDWLVRLEVRPLAWLPDYDLFLGGAYLNDATETTMGIRDLFRQIPSATDTDTLEDSAYQDNVGAWSLFGKADLGFTEKVRLVALYEMVATLQFDEDNFINAENDKSNISAINGELELVLFKNFWFGGKYDRMFGIDMLGTQRYATVDNELMPVSFDRFGGFFGVGDKSKIAGAIEYLHGQDNETKSVDTLTLQFLANF